MRVLVTYLSRSGNTQRVAENIYRSIEGDKELRPLAEVGDLDGYDLVFFGFPIIGAGAPGKARKFLARAEGRKVALFVTHGMPGDMAKLGPMLEKCRKAAGGASLVGMYDCQGRLSRSMAALLRLYPDREVRQWVKEGGERVGVGHPDQGELSAAAEFARQALARAG